MHLRETEGDTGTLTFTSAAAERIQIDNLKFSFHEERTVASSEHTPTPPLNPMNLSVVINHTKNLVCMIILPYFCQL